MIITFSKNDIYAQLSRLTEYQLSATYMALKPWDSKRFSKWCLSPDQKSEWDAFWKKNVEGFYVVFGEHKGSAYLYDLDDFKQLMMDFQNGYPIVIWGATLSREINTISIIEIKFKDGYKPAPDEGGILVEASK